MPVELNIATSEGEFDLEAKVILIGEDLLIAIWGGERPHIGAVAMSQSRPSLRDQNVISASSSVYTYLGHKEDELAKKIAETVSAALDAKVIVTAGIHWDSISKAGIQKVLKNSQILMSLILESLALPPFKNSKI